MEPRSEVGDHTERLEELKRTPLRMRKKRKSAMHMVLVCFLADWFNMKMMHICLDLQNKEVTSCGHMMERNESNVPVKLLNVSIYTPIRLLLNQLKLSFFPPRIYFKLLLFIVKNLLLFPPGSFSLKPQVLLLVTKLLITELESVWWKWSHRASVRKLRNETFSLHLFRLTNNGLFKNIYYTLKKWAINNLSVLQREFKDIELRCK